MFKCPVNPDFEIDITFRTFISEFKVPLNAYVKCPLKVDVYYPLNFDVYFRVNFDCEMSIKFRIVNFELEIAF